MFYILRMFFRVFFSILHAPKPCKGSVKLFHLISWSSHTAERCHRHEGWGCPPWLRPQAPTLGIPGVHVPAGISFTEHQTHTASGACPLPDVQVSSATPPRPTVIIDFSNSIKGLF